MPQDPLPTRSGQPSDSRLSRRPWRTLLIMLAAQGALFYLAGAILRAVFGLPMNMSETQSLSAVLSLSLAGFLAYLITPHLLRVPHGKRSFRDYLSDIRLTSFRPAFRLSVLTASCVLVLVLCQGGGSVVYRLTEGKPLTSEFLSGVFDLAQALPPRSLLLFAVFFSVFEEVAFRGVLLRMLLKKHPVRRAILYSALAFGLAHLPAVFAGRAFVATLGQVVWATLFGLFYAHLVIRTDSLVPAMVSCSSMNFLTAEALARFSSSAYSW